MFKDVQVSMVVAHDGLTMRVMGRAAALDLERGDVENVLLKGSRGYMLLTPAGPQAVLAVMARPDTNLGMLFIDTARAAAAIPAAL